MEYEYLLRWDDKEDGRGMTIRDTIRPETDMLIRANTYILHQDIFYMVWEVQSFTDLDNEKKVFIIDLLKLSDTEVPEAMRTKALWDKMS